MPEATPPASAAPIAGALSWAAVRSFYPRARPGYFILPLPEHDLVYVKNPKAACSTLVVWLDRLHTGDQSLELHNVHQEHRLPTIREVGRAKVVGMLAGAAYRFSFVRNPLDRFESVYRDKLVRSRGYRRKAIKDLDLDIDPHRAPTFDEFLGAVEEQDPTGDMDAHWRPQHANLMHPLVEYDRIGHVESFEGDLERIRDEAGLPHVPLEVRNASNRTRTDSVYDGRPDRVRRVERLYATDFELYGY